MRAADLQIGARDAVDALEEPELRVLVHVIAAQRAVGLATPEESGTDVAMPPGPLNGILSALLWCEARR